MHRTRASMCMCTGMGRICMRREDKGERGAETESRRTRRGIVREERGRRCAGAHSVLRSLTLCLSLSPVHVSLCMSLCVSEFWFIRWYACDDRVVECGRVDPVRRGAVLLVPTG